jgi:chromosome segregation ATPase
VAEVADTVRRYEELRQLSEGLIAEVESLNLQLESREDEISCLREEAKKSMSDVPVLLENTDKKNREILDLQMGLESIITKLGGNDMLLEVNEGDRTHAILGTLEKRIAFLMSESNSFRVDAQSKDVLLQNTQNLVEELSSKLELLETSLHDKQTRFENFQTEEHLKSGEIAAEVSEIEELGQSSNNSLSSVPVAPHVRSTRKASSDHLALNIDMDSDKSTSDREDDEKGHVFKSLTSTGIIPKSTRSLADRIDGIWVSGGRMLMRQPTARMGLIVYWVVLHFWMVVTLL